MQPLVPPPATGRTYGSTRRIRLDDRDPSGRLRLDAIARYLQDAATDDVDETGWGAPDHLWVVRHMRIDVVKPPVADDRVELLTWCSGTASLAAGRRLSLTGDRGGRVEADSVWIHLGPDSRPARIEGFGVYEASTAGRRVTTKLGLAMSAVEGAPRSWPLRLADLDLMGHVNNAVYWQAVEQVLPEAGPDPSGPLRARLDYRHPIDLGDEVELAIASNGAVLSVGYYAGGLVKAVAQVDGLG